MAGSERQSEHGASRAVVPVVVVACVLAVIVVALGLGTVFRGAGDDGDRPGTARAPRTAPAPPADVARSDARHTARSPSGRVPTAAEVEAGVREVAVTPDMEEDSFPRPVVVADLDGRTVLRISASDFEPLALGRLTQCEWNGTRLRRCGNSFPIQFDEAGFARVQYLIGPSYGKPGAGEQTCGVSHACVVRVGDGTSTVLVQTVFDAPAPKRTVTVTPRPDELEPGESLALAVTGHLPGARLRIALCAAPAIAGRARCTELASTATSALVAPDGTATATVVVPADAVGSARITCGDQEPCGLVVSDGSPAPSVTPAIVTFASGPGASYDATRVWMGVLVALLLLAFACWLFRTTDWRKPSEAETPVMDAAVLVDA